jgi:AraC family transcriptional regulator
MREITASEGKSVNASDPVMQLQAGARKRLYTSEHRGWSGFGAELVGIAAGVHRIPAMNEHRIGVHVGSPVAANCHCDGRRLARIQTQGDADVIPAGLDGQWADDADCTILRIAFTDDFAQRTLSQLGRCGGHARIEPRFQWRDARFQHLAWALRAELEAAHASDALYAESLCIAMIVRLVESDDASGTTSHKQALTRRTAMRVIDYIDAHLDARLTLADLARVAELSVPHFKALFRATFGAPVHRYVVERRVERAKTLLLQRRLPISQIAAECGFAHASHMAHWMKRIGGTTPKDFPDHARR